MVRLQLKIYLANAGRKSQQLAFYNKKLVMNPYYFHSASQKLWKEELEDKVYFIAKKKKLKYMHARGLHKVCGKM